MYYRPQFDNELVLDMPRKLFIDAITRVTPEVAERLLADVGPLYRELKARYDFTVNMTAVIKACKEPTTGKDFEPLRQGIFSWADEFNLGGNSKYLEANWMHECGLYTLAIHAGHIQPSVNGAITVNLKGRAPVSFTVDTEGFVAFKIRAWDPYRKDFKRYAKIAAKELQLAFDSYIDQLYYEPYYDSTEGASKKTSPDHYDWLALYQIRGWDYHKIADEYGAMFGRYVEPSRIGATVRANAMAVELNFNARIGRPKKE